MTINIHDLKGIIAIKNLKYVGEIREDSYKKAVLHSYNAAIHLYNDGYYTAAVQNSHWCADMAVKLFLWKKHLVNYTDYHNLPMSRILNWMPKQEEMQQTIADLRQLHDLYEQFGNYMEMVEEFPEHLFSTEKQDIFQGFIQKKGVASKGQNSFDKPLESVAGGRPIRGSSSIDTHKKNFEDATPERSEFLDESLFQEKEKISKIKEAAKRAVLLIDSALPVLLDFEK